jgi:hypothetical protein
MILAESSKEDHGSKNAVLPMIMTMIAMELRLARDTE